jgi:dTDP-4-amino-4,6-dideoxygalactose transaminase
MSEINCAIGIEQIKKFKSFLKKRKNNFRKIFNILKKDKNLYLVDSKNSFLKSSYYCFVVILDKEISKFRNKIIQKLNFKGVGTSIYYPNPVPFMSYYQKKYKINKKKFVNANIFSQRSISLPVGPHLSSKDVISLAKIFLNVTKSFREN